MAKAYQKRAIQACLECGQEFIAKESEIRRGGGKYCSVECSGLASRKRRGKDHYLYTGATDWNNTLRNRTEFKEWRIAVFQRDGYVCQRCMVIGGQLNAHHIIPLTVAVEEFLNEDNGATLCLPCHKYVHEIELRKWHLH